MSAFNLFVTGLWLGLVFLTIIAIGESLFPGGLKDTAFTDLGILSVMAVMMLESFFSLGSAKA